jgi:Cft2 family RNA processing exonuclease
MKVTDLNPEGGIGANSILLEIGVFRIIIDSGLNPKKSGREALPSLASTLGKDIDLIVLTHCHLDHLGSLPLILRQHREAAVLMSIPSLHLAERMLHNSVNVMLREREEKGTKEYPLFTHGEVEQVASRFFGQMFGQPRKLHKDGEFLTITLYPAGHVAGAASVLIEYRHQRILVSGDILFSKQETLAAARPPEGDVDTLILETTRGATERDPALTREAEVDRLIATINHTIEGGGSVLIPVFALGRMQELFAILARARREGRLVKCPVSAAGLGMDLVDRFDEIHRKTNLINFSRASCKVLKVERPPKEILPGKSPTVPSLYILSSGMLVEKTPSYKMAAALLANHKNAICFVGYCDPDTPGGRLLETAEGETFLFGDLDYSCPVRARIERFEMTGHADRDELVDFALSRNPRTVILTHGDPPAREWFRTEFSVRAPDLKVIDPEPLKAYKV